MRYFRHYSKITKVLLFALDTVGEGVRKVMALFSPFWQQQNSFPEPKVVLVIQCHTVGDTVMTFPAYQALRKRFPRARIVCMTEPSVAPLIQANPVVDEVIIFRRPHWRYEERKRTKNLLRPLVAVLYHLRYLAYILSKAKELQKQRFDMAIDFGGDPRRALLMVLARIPVRVGVANGGGAFLLTHPVDLPDEVHEIRRRLALVESLGAHPNSLQPSLNLPETVMRQVCRKLQECGITERHLLLVVCPCAGFPSKEWSPKNWAQVLERLTTHYSDAIVVLCAASLERKKIDAIKQYLSSSDRILDFTGQLNLLELVALLKKCDLLLCVDSGPMHIGAALRTPMVVLWSSQSQPTNFGPIYSRGNFIILQKQVPCANCRRFICPLSITCMDMITPEEVIAAAKELLANYRHNVGETKG